MYLALALSFAHVIALGPSFVGHPLTRLLWSVLWLATAGLVLVYRVGLPVYRSLRHRLEVVDVRDEAPDVVSIVCRGRHLDRLAVSRRSVLRVALPRRVACGGRRTRSRSRHCRARPHLRLTVKAVGDFTSAVAHLDLGTKVAIEGPYGAFTGAPPRSTTGRCSSQAGSGSRRCVRCSRTSRADADPVVILRASSEEDLVLSAEVDELVRSARVGPRARRPAVPGQASTTCSTSSPTFAQRDVFVAGPEGFVYHVEADRRPGSGLRRARCTTRCTRCEALPTVPRGSDASVVSR